MQLLNCQVAIGGDLNNKGVVQGITPAEVEALRIIHGQGAVSDIEIVGNMHPGQYSHEDIYFQLRVKYPQYEDRIQAYWRDNGAKFPTDVRELDLSEGAFRMPVDLMIERISGQSEGPVVRPRRGRPPKAKPGPDPVIQQFDDEPDEPPSIEE